MVSSVSLLSLLCLDGSCLRIVVNPIQGGIVEWLTLSLYIRCLAAHFNAVSECYCSLRTVSWLVLSKWISM